MIGQKEHRCRKDSIEFDQEYFEKTCPALKHANSFSYYVPFAIRLLDSCNLDWLDIGCSFGNLVSYARSVRGLCGCAVRIEAYGIDISGYAVSTSDTREFLVQGDAESLPFKDSSMDVVSALAVLEHLSSPSSCLDEIARVIKPGGLLLLVTPTTSAANRDNDPTHISIHPAEYWLSELENRGFKTRCPYWPAFLVFHPRVERCSSLAVRPFPLGILDVVDRLEEPFRHALGRLSLERGHLHLCALMNSGKR